MNMDYDESIHSLSGAYAVDALDTVERQAFEAHLDRCAECRAEVRSLREAAAQLALPDAVAPPPSLRDAVLAGAAAVRPLPPETQRHEPTGEGAPSTSTNVVPMRHRFRDLGRRSRLGLVAAAAAVITVGAGVAIQPWQSNDSSTSVVAASEILQADDAEAVSLKFPDGSQATATRSVSEGRAVLQTVDMPEPPSDRAFQVWLMDEVGRATSAGLMTEAGDRTLLLDGDASEAVAVGITVEPRAGSAEPTTEPIAMLELDEGTA